MLRRIRAQLTYANVMATVAVFVALGGSGYAALKVGSDDISNNSIRSKDIRNNTIRGKDVHRGTLTGREIVESKLGTVPKASTAAEATRVGGLTAEELKVRCPAGTALSAAACIELAPRGPAVYGLAVADCGGSQRRLPTHGELLAFFTNEPAGSGGLGTGGELTSSVFESPANQLRIIVMTSQVGGLETVTTTAGNERRFRCVAAPTN